MTAAMRWACALGILATSSCFSQRSSEGGGKISAKAAKQATQKPPNPYDIDVPPGYRIDVVADKLNYPTGIAFGDHGEMFITESGYAYGETFTEARLLRIERDGTVRVLATGDHAPWNGLTYAKGALFVAQGGEKEGGRIVRFDLDGDRVGQPKILVDHLPSRGDHHTNGPLVTEDGWVYFGQGVVTNSAIVGKDNFDFGWLK